MQDAESFYLNTQADMLNTLVDTYNTIDKQVTYLKKLLKEPELSKFSEIKQ
jgi:hypothetical protein